jgi:hypothetical protein
LHKISPNKESGMARVPQHYAPLFYGVVQAAITTAVATTVATHHLTGLGVRAVTAWGRFGETFAYDDQSQTFSLDNPS